MSDDPVPHLAATSIALDLCPDCDSPDFTEEFDGPLGRNVRTCSRCEAQRSAPGENMMVLLQADDQRMKAWMAYRATGSFSNSYKWAMADKYDDGREISAQMRKQNVEGSLWAAFIAGFEAGSTK